MVGTGVPTFENDDEKFLMMTEGERGQASENDDGPFSMLTEGGGAVGRILMMT